jgi:hypothetical protein
VFVQLTRHTSYLCVTGGPTFPDMIQEAQGIDPSRIATHTSADMTWACRVDAFQRSFSPEDKRRLITQLGFLNFRGNVKVRSLVIVNNVL